MKISGIRIHNYRSIIDSEIEAHGYLMLVGANNAGKSNVVNALRTFYDDLRWSEDDFPKRGAKDDQSWIEISFALTPEEWTGLADKYKNDTKKPELVLRRHFKGEKVRNRQSNIYAVVNGVEDTELFYGAQNVSTSKCGSIIYIPALTTPAEQMKTTGPSPLRDMLTFMLKRVVAKSPAYENLVKAFGDLNTEATQDKGFLAEISQPINEALKQWDVRIDLSVNPVSLEDISKSLIKPMFVDSVLDDTSFGLERFGHGFQRAVIYELLKLSASFKEPVASTRKEFSPDFTLLLFEEPEAFLHPSQQENMANHLRHLGCMEGQQVLITTHSPVFVGKTSGDISSIVRLAKIDGVTMTYQLRKADVQQLVSSGGDILTVLGNYVDDPEVSEDCKEGARKLLRDAPEQDIAEQEDHFRYQLWLDTERASMFFADKVLLVEGTTERALFNYLLANNWLAHGGDRIFVVDALGKFNFHRFLNLMEAFGIFHGVIFDNDCEKDHHKVINDLIRRKCNQYTLAQPVEFTDCLERHLELSLPGRPDQKPIQILKVLENDGLTDSQLSELHAMFCMALGTTQTEATMLRVAASVE